MTQEDKQLLLKDISSRLPYKVNVLAKTTSGDKIGYIVTVTTKFIYYSKYGEILGEFYSHNCDECFWLDFGLFKPYLRPMSSMTEEEREKFDKVLISCNDKVFACPEKERRYKFFDAEQEDFMNAHHFDYRGLIEKGLALEAPNDMYKLE